MIEIIEELVDSIEQAIKSGDWVVDGACDPTAGLVRAKKAIQGGKCVEAMDRLTEGNTRIKTLREMVDMQGRNGSWNVDPYMHGLYNGLEFGLSIMEKREPKFKSAPDKWLADNRVKRSFPDDVEETK